MIKLFSLLLVLYINTFATLTFDTNHKNDVDIVKRFDINPSFLYDHKLIKIKNEKISQYSTKYFFNAMDEAYLFIPMIKEILSQSEIPAEFLFLAMAESNFKTKAYSSKKAAGLWQFMPSTGKQYGLKIDDYVDERRDLVKSTKAAVKYLEKLHSIFGKWYLAAIAYNCGSGRLAKGIKKAGTDDLKVLLNPDKKYIPAESRRYIRKIVALALIGSDESFLIKSEYDFLLNRANAYSIVKVKVPRGERLSRVAKILHIKTEKLKNLNRHLKYDFVPPDGKNYEIYIDYACLKDFRQKYTPPTLEQTYIVHIVKSGDNLSFIGKKYGVHYGIIKDFNHLKSNKLSLKQKLIIPIVKPRNFKNSRYIVKQGDTLESIAKYFKVSISNLKIKNHKNGSLIKIGERLSIY